MLTPKKEVWSPPAAVLQLALLGPFQRAPSQMFHREMQREMGFSPGIRTFSLNCPAWADGVDCTDGGGLVWAGEGRPGVAASGDAQEEGKEAIIFLAKG